MYTFIINPHARSGLGGQVWYAIEPLLKEQQILYQALFTKYQHHATKLVNELTSDLKPHTIIALGGDGTVNEVINGISDFGLITFGYIPIGSSNDFARGFHLETDPAKALLSVLRPKSYSYMNLGCLHYQDKSRLFAVSSGIGFDAAICHCAVVSKLKFLLNKIKLGKLTYACIAINRLLFTTPRNISVTLDNKQAAIYEKAYFAAAMNLPCEGGGVKFCPKADPGDELLDIIVIAGIKKWKALFILPAAFFGAHVHFKGVYTCRCRTADIESEVPLPVHTDGEPVYLQRHITVSLISDKLRIITA